MPAVLFISDPSPVLEQVSWASQALMVLVGTVAAIFAGWQLLAVRKTSQATLLLELDARFDSQELRNAKILFGNLRSDINITVSATHPTANDDAKRVHVCEEWRKTLTQMRVSDKDNYVKLNGWIGFFETVGLMVKKKYISEEDVLDLFKGPLIDIGTSFRLHIQDRSKEMGVSEGLFEHALSLSEKASESKR